MLTTGRINCSMGRVGHIQNPSNCLDVAFGAKPPNVWFQELLTQLHLGNAPAVIQMLDPAAKQAWRPTTSKGGRRKTKRNKKSKNRKSKRSRK